MPWRGHIMLLQLGSEHSGVYYYYYYYYSP